ncbi:flagellar filament capping protein FliD [Cytobacillus purgationiresistens]|uniref:Flagellar hook-associated protein 2 n=1 Tax=Cytobacillus purgationiresistens TaxID=863449 RepID=A0ABU0ACV3_9BACI|nr:flagellar filament capping protein FliD [Cytobacillus purgationiresistens]MDQ0269086.1 flagellar hook-associated protein 2 [Cytobacillus purgationiresistens]
MANFRIGGLASGLDTQSLINDMMRAQRLPVDKLNQKKQTLEWQRDAYRDINLQLNSFRDMTLNMRLQSTFLSKVTSSSNSNKVTATAIASAGNASFTMSKVTQLATSATNSSSNGVSKDSNNKINSTARLYESQDKFQDGAFEWKDTGTGIKESLSVDKAGKEFNLKKLGSSAVETVTSISVSGEAFSVVSNLEDLDNEQNQVFIDQSTGKMTFSKQIAAGSKIDVEYTGIHKDTISISSANIKEVRLSHVGITDIGNEITFSWNERDEDGKVIKDDDGNPIVKSETFTKAASPDNLGENEFYVDQETGKVTFGKELEPGSRAEVSYHHKYFEIDMTTQTSKGEVTESFRFDGRDSLTSVINKINSSKLGLNVFYDEQSDKITMSRNETGDYNSGGKEINFHNSSFLNIGLKLSEQNETGGDNAKFVLNGLETERSSNTFTISGVTFNLKDKFDTDLGDPPVSISITNDTSKAIDNIKEFVKKYNELIDNLQGKLKEEKYRDYAPLSKEERDSLSDKEVERWEEKAKSGLLRSDQQLNSLLSKMRMDFYTPLNSATSDYNQLSTIGINTTKNYLDGGKLEINEDKLKEALEKDPDAVYNLFAADGETPGEQGISRRLRNSVDQAMNNITERAGNGSKTNSQFTIGKNLDDINSRIVTMEARLKEKEQRYWTQFSSMEKNMQKMNEQMNYMMSQFGYSS